MQGNDSEMVKMNATDSAWEFDRLQYARQILRTEARALEGSGRAVRDTVFAGG
jgi:hypothetical protein